MRRLPEIVALGALLAILILRAPVAGAAPSHQDDDDPWWIGVSLAMTNANGQWTAQWLGAHRYTREGGLYVVVMADASWDRLQQALATTSPAAAYVLGDTPYVGDGMCAPGAWRHWWHNGVLTTDRQEMAWQATPVPASAPALACPTNLFPEVGLVLRLAGDAPRP
jgi:hypothetical protein